MSKDTVNINRSRLAAKLLVTNAAERPVLLRRNFSICDAELAGTLREMCYEIWTGEPQKVVLITEILFEIYSLIRDKKIRAHYEWTKAISKLVNGKLTDCLNWLDKSDQTFKKLNENHLAATTQTAKLYALALLGRYDEAVACGLAVRDVFIAENDIYSAGKIEHNIGNLFWRRDLYGESEPFLASAYERFREVGDQRQMAMVENCQAFVKALQNDFLTAEKIYARALERAEKNKLTVTEAEIEIGLSNLYLFQGRFDLALKYLENSRRKYENLKMPHQTANCEMEIAEIYLELNLLTEACEFYERTEAKFYELGMQAELARSFLNHAKALFLLNENKPADHLLEKSEQLFISEGNEISAAAVKFIRAQNLLRSDHPDKAETENNAARKIFRKGANPRMELFSDWLAGEIFAAQKREKSAKNILKKTLDRAAENNLPQIEYLCLVTLGRLSENEDLLIRAIKLAENMRTILASEELRSAFLANKILPFNELVKINTGKNFLAEAFRWHERSRARSLLETIDGAPEKNHGQDEKKQNLRRELNWFYSRLNRRTSSGLEVREKNSELKKMLERREKEYAESVRRSQIGEKYPTRERHEIDIKKLQKNLRETALIEYIFLDGKTSAFVFTENEFKFFADIADERELGGEIQKFLFQLKTARFVEKLSAENKAISFKRLLRHSRNIYEMIVRPFEIFFGAKRLVVVPAGQINYLPFQSLYDGEQFLIEKTEISYAPSAAIYKNCLAREFNRAKAALIIGAADKFAPQIKKEIKTLGKLFENATQLSGKKATIENIIENISGAEILHFACHGYFRPDNPEFSSLVLYRENLTAKDVRNLKLKGKFITLSACETGLNKITAGEELNGLTNGFLAAGASALLLSLWTVSDDSTLELMKIFYEEFLRGKNPAKALQTAQIKMIEKNPHPYFWSPFILVGHW